MKKIIIFDFTRTIYDPENQKLIPEAKDILRTLLRNGFTLYLISSAGAANKDWIKKLVGAYFTQMIVAKEKTPGHFEKIISSEPINRASSFAISDRLDQEISMGNAAGLQTIWIKTGPHADKKPSNKLEQPTHIVLTLKDALNIICRGD